MYTLNLRHEFEQLLSTRENVMKVSTVEELPLESLSVVIDGESLESSAVYDYASSHPNSKVYYIINQETPALVAMAGGVGVTLIVEDTFPKWAERQNPVSHAPILTFWGVLPQLGTTTLSVAVANFLQTDYDVKACVLGLNLLDPGDWVLEKPSRYLDDLRTFLRDRKLTAEQLPNLMDTFKSGVHYLCGNRHQEMALHYSLSDFQHLLDTSTDAFDIVVIDAGSMLNTAAAIQALSSGSVYAVVTDRLYAQQRLMHQTQHVLRPLGIETGDVLLIGQKMDKPRTLASYAKATGTVPMASLADMKPTAILSEQTNERLKYILEDKGVRREVKKIVSSVAKAHGFKVKAQ